MQWCSLALLLLTVPQAETLREPQTVAVFVPQEDGFASIRIPAVVVTNRGTVLAFAEGRAADTDQAKNKLLLKRSSDGGHTWGKCTTIAAKGDQPLNNPCVVVERKSGRVLLVYQSYPAGIAERSGQLQTGLTGEKIVRNWQIASDDDGATWTQPRDITATTKRAEKVTTLASGPGIGIQLRHGTHAGRLLIPFNEGPFGLWNIYAIYSDDQGESWQLGEIAPGGMVTDSKGEVGSQVNETQFVELKDGSVRVNSRRWKGKPVRKTSVSRDGGQTWSVIEDVPELQDCSCMASVYRFPDSTTEGKSRLLYSGPNSTKRERGTIFVSSDDGATWPVQKLLVPGPFAYSCLTSLPDGTIGCLYEAEGTKRILFARFSLDWLITDKEPAP